MNDIALIESIKRLSDANGISGFEDEVLEIIREEGKDFGTFSEDSLRNLYLHRKGHLEGQPTIQLNAHTDEVGFMVRAIRPDGMIEFIPIGGWIANNIPAHLVRIRNQEGKYIPAVVASKPPHYMSEAERREPLEIANLVLDVGAANAEEVRNEFQIGLGAPIVPEATCTYDEKHDVFFGKAFDCRIGCAALLATLKHLDQSELPLNLVGDFASQEEVGLRGSLVSSQVIKADAAIVFEGSPADDVHVSEYLAQTRLKHGPMLRHIDSRMITNPRFQRFALDIASQNKIAVQEGVRHSGATNAGAIHLSNHGIPTIVIGIPVRYAHTHYGVSSLFDVKEAIRLSSEIIKHLTADIIASF